MVVILNQNPGTLPDPQEGVYQEIINGKGQQPFL